MWRFIVRTNLVLIGFLSIGTLCLAADAVTFDEVKIHRQKNPQERVLVDKVGVLTFDDASRRLTFASHGGDKLDVSYDEVTKVVFEVTTRMRGGLLPIAAVPIGGVGAGALVNGIHVHDHWFYLEYKSGDQNQPVLLEIPEESSKNVIEKATSVFGSRVTIAEFQEKGEAIVNKDGDLDAKRLPDYRSKHTMEIDKKNHPLPEVKSDKATVVVVCPSLAHYLGRSIQFKLHANDHVIAVNKLGTYSFAYVDPGKYQLISQSENANGFEIEMEAGKTYYFLQNTFEGVMKGRTMLSRNSPELVMYELNGSYFSDWKRKDDK
jgi:hypothetical protein